MKEDKREGRLYKKANGCSTEHNYSCGRNMKTIEYCLVSKGARQQDSKNESICNPDNIQS